MHIPVSLYIQIQNYGLFKTVIFKYTGSVPKKTSHRKTSSSGSSNKASMVIGREELDRVSGIFKAMSETTRLLILRELKDGAMSVGELVTRLDTSQANASKQLKTLHDAGLLLREKSGNTVFYSIKEPMVLDMCKLVCDKLNRDSSAGGDIHYNI